MTFFFSCSWAQSCATIVHKDEGQPDIYVNGVRKIKRFDIAYGTRHLALLAKMYCELSLESCR